MEFSIKDELRAAVELNSNGKETVIYDDYDNPNIMVRFDAYNEKFVGLAEDKIHPAFVIDNKGTTVSEIWVSKYINAHGSNDVAISWHGTMPWSYCGFENAVIASEKKGKGWHMMTNLEWSAIALWSWKMGHSKQGFNHDNKAALTSRHVFHDEKSPSGDVHSWFTAYNEVGDPSQSHDGSIYGIFDMNGNYRQYVDGVRVGPGFERIHYWGNPETDEITNCFEEKTYICNSIVYDAFNQLDGNTGRDPRVINKGGNETNLIIDFRFRDLVIRHSAPDDNVNPGVPEKYDNRLRELLLAPLPAMGEEVTGGVAYTTIIDNDDVRVIDRGTDMKDKFGDADMFNMRANTRLEIYSSAAFRSVYISKR